MTLDVEPGRIADGNIKKTLDLSETRAYDSALDILGAYKLSGNFHVNLEIVLEDLGALDKVTFVIEPNSELPYHSACRRVAFRPKSNVHTDSFDEIMRSIRSRIGFESKGHAQLSSAEGIVAAARMLLAPFRARSAHVVGFGPIRSDVDGDRSAQ